MIEKKIKSFIKKKIKNSHDKNKDLNIFNVAKFWMFFVIFLSFKANNFHENQINSFLSINYNELSIDDVLKDISFFQDEKKANINWDKYCKTINNKKNVPIFKNIIINFLSACLLNQQTEPLKFFYEKDFDEKIYLESANKVISYKQVMIEVETDIKKIFRTNYAEIIDTTKSLKKELF